MSDLKQKPVVLLILDGLGIASSGPGNALSLADTPNLDRLLSTYPKSILKCSGPHAGLPEGQMGNSEVGHLNIGAGRIVYQDILRISLALEQGDMESNPVLDDLLSSIRPGSSLHLMGLVSDGGVHSLQEHLHGLLDILRRKNSPDIYVHCFLDGRDTSPTSGAEYLSRLKKHMEKNSFGRIATVMGRFYAMDRDKRWERTREAYETLTLGRGKEVRDPVQGIKDSYNEGVTDEFVRPLVVLTDEGKPVSVLEDGDGVIFFNFRADRARQLTQSLFDEHFSEFKRRKKPSLSIATMTEYDKNFNLPVLFPPEKMTNILGEVLEEHSLTQLRISETEKYAHVTYFFNGGREEPFAGEKRLLIPSPREIPTYDHKPEMSAYEVSRSLCGQISERGFNFYVCNLANLDMVGHTGNITAAIKACEAVDECTGLIAKTVSEQQGILLITSDHGNAEDMLDEKGKPKTAHSTNSVPLVLVCDSEAIKLRSEGILADIAPTILDLWNLTKPAEMNGTSLLARKD